MSKFNLSHTRPSTFKMGNLVPIGCWEVLPGDYWKFDSNIFLRCLPLATPVMHPVHLNYAAFFVPTRLLWEDWEDFITSGPDGDDASVPPTVTLTYTAGTPDTGTNVAGSLADHLGVPPLINNLSVSALPFRAYNMIFNDFFRDEDIVPEADISLASGPDSTTDLTLLNVAWEKDFFTTSRPWSQKGSEVTIPVLGDAPVYLDPDAEGTFQYIQQYDNYTADTSGVASLRVGSPGGSGAGTRPMTSSASSVPASTGMVLDPNDTLLTDLAGTSGVPINDMRLALAMQRFKERMARWGNRYTEFISNSFGVKALDMRLQRPEPIASGHTLIQFSEVLQTSPDGGEGVGNLFGHGIGGLRTRRSSYRASEHGFIIVLVSARPKTVYMQALPKMWSRTSRYDYFHPDFQHLGQQEVLHKEIYAASGTPNAVWTYQDRYDEYRRLESKPSGLFNTTLKDWHLARDLASMPTFNESFITCNPSTRIFQDTEGDNLLALSRHNIRVNRRKMIKVARPMTF